MIKILKQDYLKRDDAFSSSSPASVTSAVSDIICDVIARGDSALRDYTERFDKCVVGDKFCCSRLFRHVGKCGCRNEFVQC